MKAVFIRVEDMQLKFELLDAETDAPIIYRYRVPRLLYTKSLPNRPELSSPIRFTGHDYIFCGQTHRVYIWDLLNLDHDDIKRGLEEFLKINFHPTPNHEETRR